MGADVNLKNSTGQSVLEIVSINRNQIPDYENILHIITNYKPMKICFFDQKNNGIFNSNLFIILHIICESVIYLIILPYVDTFRNILMFYIFTLLLVITFCMVHFSDPGKIICEENRSWLELAESKVYLNDYCPYCKIQKTITIKHCHVCNICVDGFDHHCNWIDNCVGINNIARFFLFILCTLFNLAFCYYISLIAFIYGDNYKGTKISEKKIFQDKYLDSVFGFSFIIKFQSKNLMALFIMSICIFFFVHVSFVLWTQIKNRGICKKLISSENAISNKSNVSNLV